jgi:hypothetical protein
MNTTSHTIERSIQLIQDNGASPPVSRMTPNTGGLAPARALPLKTRCLSEVKFATALHFGRVNEGLNWIHQKRHNNCPTDVIKAARLRQRNLPSCQS